MQRTSSSGQGGFSLIELTVAMAVTLIVSGAIFGLIAGGQTAFRREPEMADRQQNIRVAMDVILRDISNAGSGLPNFMQTFTPALDACAGCPMGPDGLATDQLEIVTNAAAVDNEGTCVPLAGGNGASNLLHLRRANAAIGLQTPVVLAMSDGKWTIRSVIAVTQADSVAAGVYRNCSETATTPHVLLDLGAGDTSGLNVAGTLCTPSATGVGTVVPPNCEVVEMGFGELVTYQIVPDAAGVPMLQRMTSANTGAGFQTLARGIEDLQVQYITAALDPAVPGNWTDNAPVVVDGTWSSLITQVRVTLSARSEAQNVQGASTAATGTTALRGRLTSTASPRSSLQALAREPVPSPTPAIPPQLWR